MRVFISVLCALLASTVIAAEEARFELTRVVSDSNGQTRFVDDSLPLNLLPFAPPAPPNEISAHLPAATVTFGRLQPDWFGDWHPTPRKQYIVLLKGAFEVTTGDGASRQISAGQVMLLEDDTGPGHRTRVIGGTAVEYVAIARPETSPN